MQTTFNTFKSFDFLQSTIYLWVFKRSATPQKFKAFFVQTDIILNSLLKDIFKKELERITEFTPYTYLAETNENSCLTLEIGGSDFEHLKTQIDRPEPECAVRSIKDIKGSEGYVVKFIHNSQTIYAIKRSNGNWKTGYPKKFINIVFKNGELSATEDNGFSIEKSFDFYCLNDKLFVASKRSFESSMAHRSAYARAFTDIQQSAEFSALFTTMQPLIDHVGNNSIQLRRMAVVEQKSLYAHPDFLPVLRTVSMTRGWGLNFDASTNQLIPCINTVKIILQVLLDHRLLSEVTQNMYDVPDATQI